LNGAAKQTIKLILHALKPKKVNHVYTPSNVRTAMESIKQMQQYVCSGKISSIKNSIKKKYSEIHENKIKSIHSVGNKEMK